MPRKFRQQLAPYWEQPPGPADVDRSNEFGARLLAYAYPGCGTRTAGAFSTTPDGLSSAGGSGSFLIGEAPQQTPLLGRAAGASASNRDYSVFLVFGSVGDGYIFDGQVSTNGLDVEIRRISGNLRVLNKSSAVDEFSSPALPATTRFVAISSGTHAGTAPRLWIDGVGVNGSGNDSWNTINPANAVGWFGSPDFPTANTFSGAGVLALVLRGLLTDAEEARLRVNPWQVFGRWALAPVSAASGAPAGTLIDSAAGLELVSGSSVLSASLLDAVSGIDLASTTAARSGALIDAAGSADINSAAPTLAAALVDAAAGVEQLSSSADRAAALVDAAAAAETASASASLVVSRVEPAAGADVQTTTATAVATSVESVAGVELASAVATLVAQLTEAASTADVLLSTMIVSTVAVEAAAGSETSTTGTQRTGSVAEPAAAAEVLATAATMVAQVIEAGSAVDQLAAAQQLVALLIEPAAGIDLTSSAAPAIYSVDVVELVAALDLLAAELGVPAVMVPSRSRGVDYQLNLPGVDYAITLGVDCYAV